MRYTERQGINFSEAAQPEDSAEKVVSSGKGSRSKKLSRMGRASIVALAGLGLIGCGADRGDSGSAGDKITDVAKGIKDARKVFQKDAEEKKAEIKEEMEKRKNAAFAADYVGKYIKGQLFDSDPSIQDYYRKLDPEAARTALANQIIQDSGSAGYIANLPDTTASVDAAAAKALEAMRKGVDANEVALVATKAAGEDKWWGAKKLDELDASRADSEERGHRENATRLEDWNTAESRVLRLGTGDAEYNIKSERRGRKAIFGGREIPEVYRFKFDGGGAWSQPIPIKGQGKAYAMIGNFNTPGMVKKIKVAWQLIDSETGEPVEKVRPVSRTKGNLGTDPVENTSVVREVTANSRPENFRNMVGKQFGDKVARDYGSGKVYAATARIKSENLVEATLVLEKPIPGFDFFN